MISLFNARKNRWRNVLQYSLDGIKSCFASEFAFQEEIFVTLIAIPIALLLPLSGAYKILLIASLFLVMIIELLNSAIEAAIDRISLSQHPLSKKAKDMGSAAVLMAILNAVIIWGYGLYQAFF